MINYQSTTQEAAIAELGGKTMSYEKVSTSFVINEVEDFETFSLMKKKGLIKDDEVYLIAEDPESSGGSGVPDGGTAGQTLIKVSDADGDVVWGDIKPKIISTTLLAGNWDNLTQTVSVEGISADETKQIITLSPSIASQEVYIDVNVRCTGQGENSLTFTADEIPSTDLTILISIA